MGRGGGGAWAPLGGALLAATTLSVVRGDGGVFQFALTRRVVNTSMRVEGRFSPLTAGAGGAPSGGDSSDGGIPGRERSRLLQDEVAIDGDFRQLAYFYMDVFVGTPPQRASVITDTGACSVVARAAAGLRRRHRYCCFLLQRL